MLTPATLPFPCYYIENTTRNGFIYSDLDDGKALLIFTTPGNLDEYRRAKDWTTCRTMVIPNLAHFAKLLAALPDSITHIVVDVDRNPKLFVVCWRVPELRQAVAEIIERLSDSA